MRMIYLLFIYIQMEKKNKAKYKYQPEEKGEDISVEKLEKFIIETLKYNDNREDL